MLRQITYILWLGFLFARPASAQPAGIDLPLQQALTEEGSSQAIVWLRDQLEVSSFPRFEDKFQQGSLVFHQLQEHAQQSQARLLEALSQKGVPCQSFFVVNALLLEVDHSLASWLLEQPEVEWLAHNPVVAQALPPGREMESVYRSDIGWGVARIGAPEVWSQGFTGRGVVIGGQDTGFEWDHPALKNKYRGYDPSSAVEHNYNWWDAIRKPVHPDGLDNPCGYASPVPCDDNGHGNLTIGVAVGSAPGHQIGVAPDATWIGCRNMDRGFGSPATYLSCFEWFLAPTDVEGNHPDPNQAPHVINNSWKCPPGEGCTPATFHILNTAVENLRSAGIVVVVSAGNDGPDCHTVDAPAAMFEGSFSVGASNEEDRIANFSSRGSVLSDSSFRLKPNVTAPGVGIPTSGLDAGYATATGTSLSGPHVAGLVALIISANPALAGKVELIEDIIEESALPQFTDQDCAQFDGGNHPNAVYGYGIVDANAAIERALLLKTTLSSSALKGGIRLYPNPVRETLFLQTRSAGFAELQILDMQGRLLFSASRNLLPTDLFRVPVGRLPAGLYLCRLSGNDFSHTATFVKW